MLYIVSMSNLSSTSLEPNTYDDRNKKKKLYTEVLKAKKNIYIRSQTSTEKIYEMKHRCFRGF